MTPERRIPTHPGRILAEEFLKPLGVSQAAFAGHIGVPAQRIRDIIHGRRQVNAEAAWLLAQALNTTPNFWLNLQSAYDLAVSRPKKAVAKLRASK